MTDLDDGDPLWPRRDALLGVHPPLQRSTRCDVLLVGAGITGALVALEMCRRGHRVVVIDRRDVGTEPLADLDRRYPDGLLFWDHDDPYLYGRTTDDGRLLIGGRDETYRDPRRRRRVLATKSRALVRDLGRRFPGAGAAELAFAWCGSFAETPDGLAYIGTHSDLPRIDRRRHHVVDGRVGSPAWLPATAGTWRTCSRRSPTTSPTRSPSSKASARSRGTSWTAVPTARRVHCSTPA